MARSNLLKALLRNIGFASALSIVSVSSATPSPGGRDNEQLWPQLRDFRMSVGIYLKGRRADVDIPVYDVNGTIQYRLICRAPGNRDVEEMERETGASSYARDLTCILNVGNSETDASLLAEDDVEAYHSRGVFTQSTLSGSCSSYPEYGLVRNFSLRGFNLTISMSPPETGRQDADGGTDQENRAASEYTVLSVSLRSDPSALTAKARRPGYIDPGGNAQRCARVQRGNAPLMCRNPSTSSWEECPSGWEFRRYPWELAPS